MTIRASIPKCLPLKVYFFTCLDMINDPDLSQNYLITWGWKKLLMIWHSMIKNVIVCNQKTWREVEGNSRVKYFTDWSIFSYKIKRGNSGCHNLAHFSYVTSTCRNIPIMFLLSIAVNEYSVMVLLCRIRRHSRIQEWRRSVAPRRGHRLNCPYHIPPAKDRSCCAVVVNLFVMLSPETWDYTNCYFLFNIEQAGTF